MLFSREPQQTTRTWFLVGLSVLLMVMDYHYHQLNRVRDYLSLAIYPIQWMVNAPLKLAETTERYTQSNHQLIEDNERLLQENLLQNASMLRFKAVEAENARLRALLKSSPRMGETLIAAEIIRVSSDPFMHRVLLDKGAKHGVSLGQTVVDGSGIVGEVIEVNPLMSRIILLTDPNYGISVENNRNGVRGIAAGTGALTTLELQHVPNTVDLKIGDTLVTSGLDGRYLSGYPVGVVSQIQQDSGESFARVQVTPSAHLDRTRHVLLIQRAKEDK